jgi:hypothetical protein
MFGTQITVLGMRKRALLLESDLNRLRLRGELAELGDLKRLAKFLDKTRRGPGPLGSLLVSLAGVVFDRGLRFSTSGVAGWRRLLAMAPAAIQLWRAIKSFKEK